MKKQCKNHESHHDCVEGFIDRFGDLAESDEDEFQVNVPENQTDCSQNDQAGHSWRKDKSDKQEKGKIGIMIMDLELFRHQVLFHFFLKDLF